MTERKAPARPRAVPQPEKAPVGRFYELQVEDDSIPGPYVLTEDITIPPMTLERHRALMAATTDEESLRVLLGDHYDAVLALYNPLPLPKWNAFITDINKHFFGPGTQQTPGKSEESSSS